MMNKFLEIRDEGTCIPVLCLEMCVGPHEGLERLFRVEECFLQHMGFEQEAPHPILMIDVQSKRCTYNPADWPKPKFPPGRTLYRAHLYVTQHWDTLGSGDVVDVEHILGEVEAPAKPSICVESRRPS